MSYAEEWARRRIVEEDYRRESSMQRVRAERDRECAFRKRHPILAWLCWGRSR